MKYSIITRVDLKQRAAIGVISKGKPVIRTADCEKILS